VFAEGDEFFDQLLTFKRSPIHPPGSGPTSGEERRADGPEPRRRSQACVWSPRGPSRASARI
jgi:hypothetical protein